MHPLSEGVCIGLSLQLPQVILWEGQEGMDHRRLLFGGGLAVAGVATDVPLGQRNPLADAFDLDVGFCGDVFVVKVH